MESLVDVRKRLSDEEKRERTQARVGLASNVLGLTAAGAATGVALRDERLKHGGPVARGLSRAGKVIPSPIEDRLKKMPQAKRNKIAAGLAVGGVGLQAANMGGDVVANRVLSREAKVEKRSGVGMEFQSPGTVGRRITDEPIRKDDEGSRRSRNQGVAIGAGGAGAVASTEALRRQFNFGPTSMNIKGVQGATDKRALYLKPPPKNAKIKNPKTRLALATIGALGSGGLATHAYKRSKQPSAKRWE